MRTVEWRQGPRVGASVLMVTMETTAKSAFLELTEVRYILFDRGLFSGFQKTPCVLINVPFVFRKMMRKIRHL